MVLTINLHVALKMKKSGAVLAKKVKVRSGLE
jgi:hypothetical protein